MHRLADDSVWQFVSAFGRSGTKKLSMSKQMPAIMEIVLLTTVKVLSIDMKAATTALSNYLKATATRASAKKYKLQHGLNVTQQSDGDNTGTGLDMEEAGPSRSSSTGVGVDMEEAGPSHSSSNVTEDSNVRCRRLSSSSLSSIFNLSSSDGDE